jgi:hypothetical protein
VTLGECRRLQYNSRYSNVELRLRDTLGEFRKFWETSGEFRRIQETLGEFRRIQETLGEFRRI